MANNKRALEQHDTIASMSRTWREMESRYGKRQAVPQDEPFDLEEFLVDEAKQFFQTIQSAVSTIETYADGAWHSIIHALNPHDDDANEQPRVPTEAEKHEYYEYLVKTVAEKTAASQRLHQQKQVIKSTGDLTVEAFRLLAAPHHYFPALVEYLKHRLDVPGREPYNAFTLKDNSRALITLFRYLQKTPEDLRAAELVKLAAALSPISLTDLIVLAQNSETLITNRSSKPDDLIVKVIAKNLLAYLNTAMTIQQQEQQATPSLTR